MWLMVQFDMPVETPAERLAYRRFRKDLARLGFRRHQKSIYLRWDDTDAQSEGTAKAMRGLLPGKGDITVLALSERTMEAAAFYHDGKEAEGPKIPSALALF